MTISFIRIVSGVHSSDAYAATTKSTVAKALDLPVDIGSESATGEIHVDVTAQVKPLNECYSDPVFLVYTIPDYSILTALTPDDTVNSKWNGGRK